MIGMNKGTAATQLVLSAATVNATATVYSSNGGYWFDARSGESFNVWATLASTGTPDVNIYIDISPFTADLAYNSTDTSKYASIKLVDALATKTALQGPWNAQNNADSSKAIDYPFCKYRIRVVGDGANPADTAVSVWVTSFN